MKSSHIIAYFNYLPSPKHVFHLSNFNKTKCVRIQSRKKLPEFELSNFLANADQEGHIFGELMKQNEVKGCTIVALSTYSYRVTTLNWIASLLRHNYTRFVIFSYDTQLAAYLAERGFAANVAIVPKHWMREYETSIQSIVDWAHDTDKLIRMVKGVRFFLC
jgi:hypothetical protein